MCKWLEKIFGCKKKCCGKHGEKCCHDEDSGTDETVAASTSTPEASTAAPMVNNSEEPKVE